MKVRSLTSCQKSLGLAVLLFSMNFAAVRAERVAALHPDVLRGVSEVRVLVEDPGGDYAPRLQLTRQQVQRAIIDQLTARGIKASPSKEGDRAGFLYVGLIFTSVNNALGKTIGVAFMVMAAVQVSWADVRSREEAPSARNRLPTRNTFQARLNRRGIP